MKTRAALIVVAASTLVAGVAFWLGRSKPASLPAPSTRPPVVEAAPAAEPEPLAAAPEAPAASPDEKAVKKRAPSPPKKKTDVVTEPVQISRVEPQLPETARRYHLHGDVVLKAFISREGNVESVTVLRGTHPLLDGAAERAVSLWKYRPATVNGRAVPAPLQVTVSFKEPGRA